MDPEILRGRINFQVGKNQPSTKKTTLEKIWFPNLNHSSDDSPPSSPIAVEKSDICALLLKNAKNTKKPRKAFLFAPPTIQKKTEKKQNVSISPFLYSNIIFKSKTVPEFDPNIIERYTYIFKGKDHQEEAWSAFKRIYKKAKQSVVTGNNIRFYFADGKVTAKSATSSAAQMIKQISIDGPFVDEEKAIDLIESIVKSEILTIYSTECFSYSVATPVVVKDSVIGSNDGDIHAIKFVGFMFPDFLTSLEHAYGNLKQTSFSKALY